MRQHIVHTHPASPSSTYASKSKTPDTTPCRISYASRETGGTPTRELTYKAVYPINPTEARNKIVQTYLQTGSKGAEPCASPAKRHDAGTPPPNACASGCNTTHNTANKVILQPFYRTIRTNLLHRTKPQAKTLALWSDAIIHTGTCGLTTVATCNALLLRQPHNTLRQRR